MHQLLLFVTLLAGGVVASYRGYYVRNLYTRDATTPDDSNTIKLVECPVCDSVFPPSNEKCDVQVDGRKYKQCRHGIYENIACNRRLDCYRGPREHCTTNNINDLLDFRCAPGLHCDTLENVCIGGKDGVSDSHIRFLLSEKFNRGLDGQPIIRERRSLSNDLVKNHD